MSMPKMQTLMERFDGKYTVEMVYWRDAVDYPVTIEVVDNGDLTSFTLFPPADEVMEWFLHPFCHATSREVSAA